MLVLLLLFICLNCLGAEQNYEMNWLSQNSMFLTKYHHDTDTISFTVAFRQNILDQLPNETHSLCNVQTIDNELIFSYTYGSTPQTLPFPDHKQKSSEGENYNPNYHIHMPLIQNDDESQNISEEMLSTFLQQKTIAWYTGAGISAAVVPAMQELENSLGIINTKKNERLLNVITTALQKPELIATIMHSFYQKCLNGNPTDAHKAIAQYAHYQKDCIVFTENLDTLHEQTGINPQRIENPIEFAKIITPQLLQKIDVLLCVGLSHDDRGLLGYYKHHNPQGIIVALCLDKPTYLGKTDYFIQQNAQKLIPQLIQP